MLSWHYPLVLITGAAVLVLEILGTRLIAPVFGSTIYVWSSLITVTLAALALGYAAGGWLADRRRPMIVLALALVIAGLWVLVLPVARRPVLIATAGLGVQGGALAASTALFVVPLTCLAAVGPLCVRLRTRLVERVGREVGGISAISTLGSVIGALAAGFWLVPLASATRILLVTAIVLLGCAVFVSWVARADLGGSRRIGVATAVLLVLGVAGAKIAPAEATTGVVHDSADGDAQVREKARSFYGDVKLVDRVGSNRRLLYVDGLAQTAADLQTLDSLSDYITGFELLAFMRPRAERTVILGLGGGGIVNRLERHYGITTDAVEIDPVMEYMARKWFDFDPEGRVFIEDGRRFLERDGDAYDLLLFDVFIGDRHPTHLFSIEAFGAAKHRLVPGGVVAVHVASYAYGRRAGLRRAVERTLGEVFANVRILVANRNLDIISSPLNLLVFASDGPLDFVEPPAGGRAAVASYYRAVQDQFLEPDDTGVVVTDDYNPIEALNAPLFIEIRRGLLENRSEVMSF